MFAAAVEASELLGVDEELRALWIDCRDNMASYPLRTDEGAVWAGSTNESMKESLATDEPAWAQGLAPYYFILSLIHICFFVNPAFGGMRQRLFYREHKLVGISLLGNLSEMEELKKQEALSLIHI